MSVPPRHWRTFLSKQGHECRTVQEAGWSGKQNGELLGLAEGLFDVLVTVDTNLQYQRNLASRELAVIVLLGKTNRLADLSLLFAGCAAEIGRIRPGEVVSVSRSAV